MLDSGRLLILVWAKDFSGVDGVKLYASEKRKLILSTFLLSSSNDRQ
jgi:hypothetical protein